MKFHIFPGKNAHEILVLELNQYIIDSKMRGYQIGREITKKNIAILLIDVFYALIKLHFFVLVRNL